MNLIKNIYWNKHKLLSNVGECVNEYNDKLEFLGDKILGYYVTKNLIIKVGYVKELYNKGDNSLIFGKYILPKEYNANLLTELIKKYTRNDYLKERIEYFGINKFINAKNKNINDKKYEADVFEAIIGAVAIDCEFDEIKITNVVNNMIGIH